MHDSDPPRFHLTFVWSICLVAAMGGLLFGYDWVVIGGAKPFYEPYFGISDRPFMQGLAMSSALIGCLAGALVAGTLSDRFGRKRLLILAGLLFTISAIGTALSFDFVTFNVFRWIGGAGIGIASSLSPMYIAEVAPAELRGRFVSINQLTIVIGILAAQLVNWQIAQPVPTADHLRELTGSASPAVIPSNQHDAMIGPDSAKTRALVEPEALKEVEEQFPDLKVRSAERAVDESERKREDEHVMDVYLRSTWNGQRGWRWMFGAETFLAAAFFLLMFVVPESPRWLVKFGRDAEAETILARIGGTRYGKAEVADIRRTLADQKTTGLRLSELNEPRLRRIIGLGVFLAVFQQWCGINVIFNYAQEVFEAVGYGVSDIMLNIVITGIVNLVFTFVAIFTVDRFGRRGLMLIGFGGLAVIYAVLGAGFYRLQSRSVHGHSGRLGDRLLCHVTGPGHLGADFRAVS